ncbi:MAG: sulfatase-like hydrolase/transferase, partial [Longimicrobiales bacterium]
MRAVLLLGVWFGLVTGTGAVGLWAIKAFVLDQVTLITPHIVWTSPLTFLILGLAAGALLIPVTRLLPRLFRLHVVVFILAVAGCACGLLIWGTELHRVAVGLLSLGIAVQMATFAKRRPDAALRFVRRTLHMLAGFVLLLAAALVGGTWAIESWTVSRLPAARAGSPNVLVLILDTVRAANLSLYGYTRPTTPNLERLAAAATTFDNAFAASPWTLPSHSAMFTGRAAHELSAGWTEPLDETFPTIAEHLREHGYRTGGFAGNFFYCNSEWGVARGFIHYEDYEASLGHALLSTFPGHWLVRRLERARLDRAFWFHRIDGRKTAPAINRSLVRWLERDRERPFFAFVNYYDAHDPYVAPEPFMERMTSISRRDSVPIRKRENGTFVDVDAAARRGTLDQLDRYDA